VFGGEGVAAVLMGNGTGEKWVGRADFEKKAK
jgi:hypothetical protein